jgi:hypothetical protein
MPFWSDLPPGLERRLAYARYNQANRFGESNGNENDNSIGGEGEDENIWLLSGAYEPLSRTMDGYIRNIYNDILDVYQPISHYANFVNEYYSSSNLSGSHRVSHNTSVIIDEIQVEDTDQSNNPEDPMNDYESLVNLENVQKSVLISPSLPECSDVKIFRCSEDYTVCVVCQEYLIFNDIIRTMNCSHKFHIDCIDKWFTHSHECPICKKNFLS